MPKKEDKFHKSKGNLFKEMQNKNPEMKQKNAFQMKERGKRNKQVNFFEHNNYENKDYEQRNVTHHTASKTVVDGLNDYFNMMRVDNTEEQEYEQADAQSKYKKMFKVDEQDFDDEEVQTTFTTKVKLTTQEGTINGSRFIQLRIPKRYEADMDVFKKMFKDGNADEAKDQIIEKEQEIFLKWRRDLNRIETEMNDEQKQKLARDKGFLKNRLNKVTPQEKNLDIWRQLWITVESCELLCIIIDSRNPLFFKNTDLEDQIKQLGKKQILIMNKADLIVEEVRQLWSKQFSEKGIKILWYCAKESGGKQNDLTNIKEPNPEVLKFNPTDILSTRDLLKSLYNIIYGQEHDDLPMHPDFEEITFRNVGFIGWPNVGKSSIINSIQSQDSTERGKPDEAVELVGQDIFQEFEKMLEVKNASKKKAATVSKKVEVSAMPGKTKVVQTIYIPDFQLKLYDCPGLVFPSLMENQEDMQLYGILNVSNCRDLLSIFCRVIDYFSKEDFQYFLRLKNKVHSDQDLVVFTDDLKEKRRKAEILLDQISSERRWFTSNDNPDRYKSARLIINEMIIGNLVWSEIPYSPEEAKAIINQEDPHVYDFLNKPNFVHEIVQYTKYQETLKDHLDSHIDIDNLPNRKDELILEDMKEFQKEKNVKLDKWQRRELKQEMRRNPNMSQKEILEYIQSLQKDANKGNLLNQR